MLSVSTIVKSWPDSVKRWVSLEIVSAKSGPDISGAGSVSSVSVGVSKLMSVNVGALSSKDDEMSKSVGNGKSSGEMSVWPVGSSGIKVGLLFVLLGVGLGYAFSRQCMRLNAWRNSAGISGDSSISIGFMMLESGVVDSGSGSVVVGAVSVVRNNLPRLIFGKGTVNSGCFLRTIKTVLAIYRGRAESIIMPNTKPAKPCSLARIRRCHMCPSNMLKLNKKYNIAHMKHI